MALALSAGPATAAVSVVWERDLTADMLSSSFPYNNAFEPIVATHPTDSQKLAVVYEYRPSRSRCNGIVPGLRTSTDGGATWHKAAGKPWAGSGRIPNYHGTIAWGPGPAAGSARLYWADSTVSDCTYSDHRLSIAYSDDRGATWSALFVAPGAAEHGYPDLAVDRNRASPNYGAVYATMNPLKDTSETAMPVWASSDYGRHWQSTNVPALAQPSAAYPFQFRQGYRLRSAPDGSVYASFCQVDRASQNSGSFGRVAFGIARLRLNRALGTFSAAAPVLATTVPIDPYALEFAPAPGTNDRERLYVCWTHGIDVEPASGRVHIAVATYVSNPPSGTPRGRVRVGRSNDLGQTWSWQTLPVLAPDGNGRHQSAHKPTLVAKGQTVFVGFHVLSDVPLNGGLDSSVMVGNAFVVSNDGGSSWGSPRLVSASRWNPDWLDLSINGAGLRDRAELTAGGRVLWAYGDGRRARAKPDTRWGRSQVYAALIDL